MNFRLIPECRGLYEVSKCGTVRNVKTKRVIKPELNSKGYFRLNLRSVKALKKRIFVHRAVMAAWRSESSSIVNHKDGDRTNNHIDNLEYCTYSENGLHAAKLGLLKTGEEHRCTNLNNIDIQILRKLREVGHTYKLLGEIFCIDPKSAWNIVNRKTWKYVD